MASNAGGEAATCKCVGTGGRMWERTPPCPGQRSQGCWSPAAGLAWNQSAKECSEERWRHSDRIPSVTHPQWGGPAQCHSLTQCQARVYHHPRDSVHRYQRVSGSSKCHEDLRTEGSRDGKRDDWRDTGYWRLTGAARGSSEQRPRTAGTAALGRGPQLGRKARGRPLQQRAGWEGSASAELGATGLNTLYRNKGPGGGWEPGEP